jgi:hypothetical protein
MANDHEEKTVEITVNARPHQVEKGDITFDQVVALAFGVTPDPQAVFTITWERGHGSKDGILPAGGSVQVKEGMIFNVSATGQS